MNGHWIQMNGHRIQMNVHQIQMNGQRNKKQTDLFATDFGEWSRVQSAQTMSGLPRFGCCSWLGLCSGLGLCSWLGLCRGLGLCSWCSNCAGGSRVPLLVINKILRTAMVMGILKYAPGDQFPQKLFLERNYFRILEALIRILLANHAWYLTIWFFFYFHWINVISGW